MMAASSFPDWMVEAACAGQSEVFFPDTGASADEARFVCGPCPVRAECLEYALAHTIGHGVWGGLTVRERRRLKRGPDECES